MAEQMLGLDRRSWILTLALSERMLAFRCRSVMALQYSGVVAAPLPNEMQAELMEPSGQEEQESLHRPMKCPT